MRLSDPLRPTLPSGQQALLIDGSAVPRLSIFPEDETMVEVVVMLRAYDASHSFTYDVYRHKCARTDLGALLHAYYLDPEMTLEAVFGWKPQPIVPATRATPTSRPVVMPAELAAELQAQLDII